MNVLRRNWGIVLIVLVSILLGGIVLLTALKLQTKQPVAPNAPASKPKALEPTPTPSGICTITIPIGSTPTPSPTESPTPSASPTQIPTSSPTASPTLQPSASPTVVPTASPTSIPTSVPTVAPTPTPTPTPTQSPVYVCNDICSSNSQCPANLFCYNGRCRNPQCPTSSNCVCPVPTAIPTPTATPRPIPTSTPVIYIAQAPTPTPRPVTPSVPVSGNILPTAAIIGIGILFITLGLAL